MLALRRRHGWLHKPLKRHGRVTAGHAEPYYDVLEGFHNRDEFRVIGGTHGHGARENCRDGGLWYIADRKQSGCA